MRHSQFWVRALGLYGPLVLFLTIILFKIYYFITLYISFYIPQNRLILAEVLEFLIVDIIL